MAGAAGDASADSFSRLLACLAAEHQREVESLQGEIRQLQAALGCGGGGGGSGAESLDEPVSPKGIRSLPSDVFSTGSTHFDSETPEPPPAALAPSPFMLGTSILVLPRPKRPPAVVSSTAASARGPGMGRPGSGRRSVRPALRQRGPSATLAEVTHVLTPKPNIPIVSETEEYKESSTTTPAAGTGSTAKSIMGSRDSGQDLPIGRKSTRFMDELNESTEPATGDSSGNTTREGGTADPLAGGASGDDCVMSHNGQRRVNRKKNKFHRALLAKSVSEDVSRLRRMAGRPLDLVMSVVISLNAVSMILELELTGYALSDEYGYSSAAWIHRESAQRPFDFIDHIVNVIFLIELTIKLIAFRSEYFYFDGSFQAFHIFDFAVVVLSCIDLYVIGPIANWNGGSFGVMRLTRVMRIARTVRIVGLTKLRVLIQTFIGGFGALGWSSVLLVLCMYIGAAVACQCVQANLRDPTLSSHIRQWAYDRYGTGSRAFWTMFELTFSGGWPNYVDPLVEEVSGWYVLLFGVYVLFVIFGALRIATALLIRDTLAAASNDASLMVEVEMQNKKKYAEMLRAVFEVMDTSGDGKLSISEFHEVVDRPEARELMRLLDVQISDVNTLFRILDDGDGLVTFDEFLSGLLRVKGNARAMDVVAIMYDCNRLLSISRDILASCCPDDMGGGMTKIKSIHSSAAAALAF